MAERERKAFGAAAATAPFEPAAVSTELLRGVPAESNGQAASWEDVYRTASSAQRQELLALASRQGLIYSHQFPPANGHKPHEDSEALATLTRVLEARADLPPSSPQPVAAHDTELDRMQQEAVSRALASPDICLIAGASGTGKSRVCAEILTQAASRGERVLFLARRPAALDQVLARLAGHHVVLPMRCLEAGEKPDLLPAGVRSLTFAEHVRKLRETLPEAVRSKQRTEDRCRLRHHEQSLWPLLAEVAEAAQKLREERDHVQQQRVAVPDEVAREVGRVSPEAAAGGGLAALIAGEQRRQADTLAELDAAVAKVEQARAENAASLKHVEEEITSLRTLVWARKERRFWTWTWWRAIFNGRTADRLIESAARAASLQDTITAAFEELNCLHQKRRQIEDEHRTTIEQLRDDEIRRRQQHWDSRETSLERDWHALQAKWSSLIARLENEQTRPAEMSPGAVEEARRCWQQVMQADEENCRFAGQWASFLQESLETLPQRLPGLVNVVAATPAGLAADKHFSRTADFDLLVVDEAEQINEAEFLNIGRRARRWVLVGNAGQEKAPVSKPPLRNGRVHALSSRHKTDSFVPSHAGPVSLFQRLWQAYRCELPATGQVWLRESDRLCCRLKTIDTDQRKHLECERVADFPDIELRILTLPHAAPALAEVVFPASMSLAQAKEYIYHELQELPLETTTASACLIEDHEHLVVHFGRLVDAAGAFVTLEKGLREGLVADASHPTGWRTCRLEFDKAAGWEREGVQTWLFQRCRLRDLGRTAFLQQSYGAPRAVTGKVMCTPARGTSQLYAGS